MLQGGKLPRLQFSQHIFFDSVKDLHTAEVLKGQCDFTAASPIIKPNCLFLLLYYHILFSDPSPKLKG